MKYKIVVENYKSLYMERCQDGSLKFVDAGDKCDVDVAVRASDFGTEAFEKGCTYLLTKNEILVVVATCIISDMNMDIVDAGLWTWVKLFDKVQNRAMVINYMMESNDVNLTDFTLLEKE